MPPPARQKYDLNVFINCPFDRQYLGFFRAIVFTVHDCGYIARCAQEVSNAAQVRVQKIMALIKECRVGIHDISRTETSGKPRLPRFNMPLELGMFLAAREYGTGNQKEKTCLVLDSEPYRYQKFCSDISGQDVYSHDDSVETAVEMVRNFLRNAAKGRGKIPGAGVIHKRYVDFTRALPTLCRNSGLTLQGIPFVDYISVVEEWLALNPRP